MCVKSIVRVQINSKPFAVGSPSTKSSLYLPCRFSQPSAEFRGDVPFPQDAPPQITQCSMKIATENKLELVLLWCVWFKREFSIEWIRYWMNSLLNEFSIEWILYWMNSLFNIFKSTVDVCTLTILCWCVRINREFSIDVCEFSVESHTSSIP